MGKIPFYNSYGEIIGYEIEETPQERDEWLHQAYLERIDAGWDEDEDEEDVD